MRNKIEFTPEERTYITNIKNENFNKAIKKVWLLLLAAATIPVASLVAGTVLTTSVKILALTLLTTATATITKDKFKNLSSKKILEKKDNHESLSNKHWGKKMGLEKNKKMQVIHAVASVSLGVFSLLNFTALGKDILVGLSAAFAVNLINDLYNKVSISKDIKNLERELKKNLFEENQEELTEENITLVKQKRLSSKTYKLLNNKNSLEENKLSKKSIDKMELSELRNLIHNINNKKSYDDGRSYTR